MTEIFFNWLLPVRGFVGWVIGLKDPRIFRILLGERVLLHEREILLATCVTLRKKVLTLAF